MLLVVFKSILILESEGNIKGKSKPSTCSKITHGNWKLVVDDLFVGMTFPRDEQFAIYTP
jgi:hypothetical protein